MAPTPEYLAGLKSYEQGIPFAGQIRLTALGAQVADQVKEVIGNWFVIDELPPDTPTVTIRVNDVNAPPMKFYRGDEFSLPANLIFRRLFITVTGTNQTDKINVFVKINYGVGGSKRRVAPNFFPPPTTYQRLPTRTNIYPPDTVFNYVSKEGTNTTGMNVIVQPGVVPAGKRVLIAHMRIAGAVRYVPAFAGADEIFFGFQDSVLLTFPLKLCVATITPLAYPAIGAGGILFDYSYNGGAAGSPAEWPDIPPINNCDLYVGGPTAPNIVGVSFSWQAMFAVEV